MKKNHRRRCFRGFAFWLKIYNYWPKRIFHSLLSVKCFRLCRLDTFLLFSLFIFSYYFLYICFKVPIINLIFAVACLNNNCKVFVTEVGSSLILCFFLHFFFLCLNKGLWHFIMHFMSKYINKHKQMIILI